MASGSTIKIRRSAQAGKIPTTTDLALGELALNTNDGKIFLKKLSGGVEEIVALEKQLTAGTGVTITSGAINIGQNVSTTTSPTFAGAALNGITTITQTVLGKQDPLRVAGYVGSSGSVFTVGVSDTPSDGVTIKSLTSDLSDNAKLSLSGSQIILKTTNKQWSFSDNGNIQLPAGGDIVNSNNTSVLKFPVVKNVTFDNYFIENNYNFIYNIDGTTNKISTSGLLSNYKQRNFEVNGIVTFFGPRFHTEVGVANIVPYQSYYIKTLDVVATASDLGLDQPDPFTDEPALFQSSDPILFDITISETIGGSTFDLLDFHTESEEEAIVISTVAPTSYQTQRAPRHFQNYDEQGNDITGEMINATFGDTYYNDQNQHIYIYANTAGDGTPQRFDITTGL